MFDMFEAIELRLPSAGDWTHGTYVVLPIIGEIGAFIALASDGGFSSWIPSGALLPSD